MLYYQNLDILNVDDPESGSTVFDNEFWYYKVTDDDDPGVDVYVIDSGTRCNHYEFNYDGSVCGPLSIFKINVDGLIHHDILYLLIMIHMEQMLHQLL